MKKFLDNLLNKFSAGRPAEKQSQPKQVQIAVARARPKSRKPKAPPAKAETVELSTEAAGKIADGGPGKNVLIRNRYLREDTGTHETLKIVDDSILESQEEDGFDPYNTGRFDRGKSWNNRTRK